MTPNSSLEPTRTGMALAAQLKRSVKKEQGNKGTLFINYTYV
jgi:hypothetical protein